MTALSPTDSDVGASSSIASRLLVFSALVMVASYFLHDHIVGYDGAQYLQFATNLLKTEMFTFDGVTPSAGRTPGYPALLAAIIAISGDWTLIYPLQFACLWATFWLVGLGFRDVLGKTQRAVMVTLLVLTIPLHRLAADVVTETTFFLLTAAGLLGCIRGVKDENTRWLMLSAVFFGLSSYIRPVNIATAPFLALVFIMTKRLSWTRGLLYAVVSILVMTPWTIRNAAQFDRLIPMASHVGSFYYMTDAEAFWPVLFHSAGYSHVLPIHEDIVGDELELDIAANERYMERGIENVTSDPLGFLGRCVFKTVFVWSYLPGTKGTLFSAPWLFALGVIVQWCFLLLAVFGMRSIRQRAPELTDTVGGYALYTILLLFPMYAESRFLLPVYIWLAGFAFYAVYEKRDRIMRRLPRALQTRLRSD
ncbi:MAG: hypothetical protein GF341_11640 [candidate division Zixibacteria bacterium]|nr:hypothetical protein [candidate division Zixibacteria bacterium]